MRTCDTQEVDQLSIQSVICVHEQVLTPTIEQPSCDAIAFAASSAFLRSAVNLHLTDSILDNSFPLRRFASASELIFLGTKKVEHGSESLNGIVFFSVSPKAPFFCKINY